MRKSASFPQIGAFAILLTAKSRILMKRAVINKLPASEFLEIEMGISGSKFVRRFADKYRNVEKSGPRVQ